jgi:excisionase family DNA binding protein
MRIKQLSEHTGPYLTPRELAEYWGVSTRLIYRQIQEGKLKAVRLGPRLMRIKIADAQQFEMQRQQHPEHEGIT